MASSAIEDLRKQIKNSTLTELGMYSTDEGMKDMLDSIQVIKSKMNEEILQSIKEITQKYQPEIDDLEEQYAFLASLKAKK